MDPWLPQGFKITSAGQVARCTHEGPHWQIYESNEGGAGLVVELSLYDRWVDLGLVSPRVFEELPFGSHDLRAFGCEAGSVVEPLAASGSPETGADALAFAAALKATRELAPDAPLHDGIYVENLARILPTFSLTRDDGDEVLLGRWLTGGANVAATSLRRVHALTAGWLSKADIEQVLSRAGLSGVADGGAIAKIKEADAGAAMTAVEEAAPPPGAGSRQSAEPREPFQLPGRPELAEFFRSQVLEVVFNPEKYRRFGIGFPGAIALEGPPGCGKTYAVERLVEYLDWPCYAIDAQSIASPYIHDTSKKIAEVFDRAMDSAPSVIVFDEMEAYFATREGSQSGGGLHHTEELGELLRRIPEATKNRVLMIGMTNRVDMVDPAILRKGRFDHVIKVGPASTEEIIQVLEHALSGVPVADDINFDSLAARLEGRPLSDVSYVVREAGRHAAANDLEHLDQALLVKAAESLGRIAGGEPESRPIGFIWQD